MLECRLSGFNFIWEKIKKEMVSLNQTLDLEVSITLAGISELYKKRTTLSTTITGK